MEKVQAMTDLQRMFYVSFFGELEPLLLKTFNYSFEKGELSASQKQAAITLIQKKIEMLS